MLVISLMTGGDIVIFKLLKETTIVDGNSLKDKVTDVIIDEYLKEFACENKSFFTIVRNGKAFTRIPSLVGRENEQNILYIPVADACLNTNSNITQTPGLDK